MNQGYERASGFIQDLGDAARNNPVSAALIGMGALWLFAGRTEGAKTLIRGSGIDRLPDSAREAWEGSTPHLRAGSQIVQENFRAATDRLRDRGAALAQDVSESGGRLASSVADYASDVPDRAAGLLDDVRANMTELFREQPLAL